MASDRASCLTTTTPTYQRAAWTAYGAEHAVSTDSRVYLFTEAVPDWENDNSPNTAVRSYFDASGRLAYRKDPYQNVEQTRLDPLGRSTGLIRYAGSPGSATLTASQSRTRIRDLTLEVSVVARGTSLLGRLRPTIPVDLDLTRSELGAHEVQLELPVRPEQLEAVEQLRGGADLKFQVRIGALFVRQDGTTLSRWTSPDFYTLNQSHWTQLLRDLGFASYILIEVPVPEREAAPEYAHAVAHLREAQDALFGGRYRAVVDLCGNALESLAKDALADYGQLGSVKKDEANDKQRRMQYLRYALWHVANLGRHAGGITEQTEWERDDALAMLSFTATTLRWCARQAIAAEKRRQ